MADAGVVRQHHEGTALCMPAGRHEVKASAEETGGPGACFYIRQPGT